MYSVTGQRLPSARHISNIINRGLGENIYHNHISQFFPYFGQFLIHEMVLTPIHTSKCRMPIFKNPLYITLMCVSSYLSDTRNLR